MANMFEVQVPNVLQSLMFGDKVYQDASQARSRLLAAEALKAGRPEDALATLLGQGDIQGAATVGALINQQAQRGFQERTTSLAERQATNPHVMQDPNSGALIAVPPSGEGAKVLGVSGQTPSPIPIPPGADPKTYRTQIAMKNAQNEEDVLKSAKAAAEFKPFIDQAVQAYEEAIKRDAIGPVVGNPIVRKGIQGATAVDRGLASLGIPSTPGAGKNEEARQNYDQALQNVQLRITAAQNKGEGQVSNFERQMYASQFPDLQALNPKQKLEYLKQIQAQTDQTISAGRGSPLATGSTPNLLNRSSVFGQGGQQGPVKLSTKQEYDALPSGTQYIAPDGSLRTKQ